MNRKILQFTFLSVALAIIYFTNVSYSSGPPTTAATGGCNCHGPANSNTNVQVSFNGGNLYYNNGQTYPITITVFSSTAKVASGFALSTNVGTMGVAPSGTKKVGNVWMHDTPNWAIGVFTTFTTWTIDWTAPATGAVPLQIYAAGNAVDLMGGSTGDEWNFAPSLNIALPVNFVNFSATRFEKNNVLNWTVSNEENLKEYQIERSENGKDFTIIGTVEARNYSKYEFIDNEQMNSTETYFRIKAVDIDGKEIYSTIKAIRNEVEFPDVKIFPTIISSNEKVNILNATDDCKVLIYSTTGTLIKTYTIDRFSTFIDLNSISEGIYFVGINKNNHTKLVDKIIVR